MTAETYVNQIVKKVKCPKQKRSEIAKQLLADIYTELEQGENLERIMLRMGEPIAVAEEFNQNLPEEEHRKYKRTKALKIAGVIVAVLAVLAAAAAAAGVVVFLMVQEYGRRKKTLEGKARRQEKPDIKKKRQTHKDQP